MHVAVRFSLMSQPALMNLPRPIGVNQQGLVLNLADIVDELNCVFGGSWGGNEVAGKRTSRCLRLGGCLLHHGFKHFGEHAGDGAGAALMPDQHQRLIILG